MTMRFEWADVNPGGKAVIYNDIALDEHGADPVEPGTVGVSMGTGGNGVMLYGSAEALADWAEDVARRLRAGEGKSGYGEEREFVFPDRFYLVRDAAGAIYEAGQLDSVFALRDNSGAEITDGVEPEPLTGDTWQVIEPGTLGYATDGQRGFIVRTRRVLDRP